MGSKFDIAITATDKTAAGRKSVETNLARLVKGTGLEKINKGFAGIQEKGKAFGNIARSLFSMGDSATIAGEGIGEAAGGLGALGAAATVATLGVVAVGAGLGVAGQAAYRFEDSMSKSGARVAHTAAAIGISTDELQKFQEAARLAGGTADGMSSALQGVGDAMQGALAGRNDNAKNLMTLLGVDAHFKDGQLDTTRGLIEIAAAMKASDAGTQRLIVSVFGLGGAMEFAKETTAQQQAQLKAAVDSGAVMTGKQLAQSTAFQTSITTTDLKFHGLLNTISTNMVIPWLKPAIDGLGNLESAIAKTIKGARKITAADWLSLGSPVTLAARMISKIGQAYGQTDAGSVAGRASGQTGGGRPGGHGDRFAKVREAVIEYFQATGWTREQAAGIAANIQNESGFDIHSRNKTSGMYGLANWDTTRRGNFASRYGHNITDSTMAEQLDFINYELRFGPGRLETRAGHRLRLAATASEAAGVMNDMYERNDVPGQAAARGRIAENAVHGTVDVNVNVRGVPHGSSVTASASGRGVKVGARIAPSLAGAAV